MTGRRTAPARERERLGRVAILSDLSEEEIELVLRISRRIAVPVGTVIMREEEVGDTMFFFAEGEVDVSKSLTLKLGRHGFGNAEKSMVKLNANMVSFFGEMAMFENEPRSATITASTDCVVYEVRQEDFVNLCDERPDIGMKILRRIATTLSHRIRKGNEDVLKLTTALSIALSK